MTQDAHPSRRLHPLRPALVLLLVLLPALAGIAGCGGSDSSPAVMVSPEGWVQPSTGGGHAVSAVRTYTENGATSCAECHGSDLAGGTANVSCYGNPAGCHHGTVAGWTAASPAAQSHGAAAKSAAENSGFAACRICHGETFAGGGSQVSCFVCHGATAPHPAGLWRGTNYTHVNTGAMNVSVCAQCHVAGSPNNPAGHPAAPAPAGTAPGCFNSTLCHGPPASPHGVGTTWRDPGEQFHGFAARQDLSYCQGCHGTPGTILFDGGAATTSCQTPACHPQAKAHPVTWYQAAGAFPAYVSSHRNSGNREVACAICHKTDGTGGGPDPAAPGCFAPSFGGVSCHAAGPAAPDHPVPFLGAAHTSVAAIGFAENCGTCHYETGAAGKTGPTCTVCHKAGSPLATSNCASCHADPPDGGAAEYPDVAGAHAGHLALKDAGTLVSCNTCHDRLGTDTLSHYNRANARPGKDALRVPPGSVAILAAFDAKSGTSSFNAADRTCSNVSCHGGQTTPDWREAPGAIDVVDACTKCHFSGTAQYNSYNSGKHELHVSSLGRSSATCKLCHDAAKVNVIGHFQNLATYAFEQSPSATILSSVGYNRSRSTCSPACHGRKKW